MLHRVLWTISNSYLGFCLDLNVKLVFSLLSRLTRTVLKLGRNGY